MTVLVLFGYVSGWVECGLVVFVHCLNGIVWVVEKGHDMVYPKIVLTTLPHNNE